MYVIITIANKNFYLVNEENYDKFDTQDLLSRSSSLITKEFNSEKELESHLNKSRGLKIKARVDYLN